jgi:AcrR family transcriptional regulator
MTPRVDPLFDTLFRPTTPDLHLDSALPVRAPGTRTRAGNSMGRTRAALLDGAARAVSSTGTRITMAQVASDAGVAKATLYNHFRTRDAVLQALLAAEVGALIAATADKSLERALNDAAVALSQHPVLRGLAQVEPATLAALARIDTTAEQWGLVREAIEAKLAASGRSGTATVLRWLTSYLLSPDSGEAIAADLEVLLAGLPIQVPAPLASGLRPESIAG